MFKKFLIPLLLLMPGFAFAANLFDPAQADKSMLILAAIFGKLDIFGPSGNDPFAAGIQAFNGAVLMIGGIIVAYTIVAGTVGTAHEGEMLGKKFSSVWVPIRTALGTALVLPVINGTYCVMQAIVGWLIVQGIGLADNVWKEYTRAENLTSLLVAGNQNIGAKSFGYNVFQSQVCVAAINKVIELEANNTAALPLNGNISATTTTETIVNAEKFSTSDKINFGVFQPGSKDPLPDWNCGSATIPKTAGTAPSDNTLNGLNRLNPFDIVSANIKGQRIMDVQYASAYTMVNEMKTIAQNFISSGALNTGDIDTAISKYEKAVQDAATAELANSQNFSQLGEQMSVDGWLMAGAFYTKISSLTDIVQRSMSALGTATGPNGMNNPLINDTLSKYNSALMVTLNKYASVPISAGFGVNENNKDDRSWARLILSGDFDALMKKVFPVPHLNLADGEHPLMAMKRLGNTLISFIGVSLGIGLVAVVAANIPSTGGSFFLTLTVLGLIMPIVVSGILLSYLLPMLPFFLWFGATIGWVIMCIEALLAAPMWAVMHLSPHGDDMVGTGSQGYKLVLSLMLRPVLMIFGLIASFVGLNVIGGFFNQIFFDVFAINQQDTSFIPWIFGLIIAPLMYAIGMFVLIKKLFSMIYIIPDEMLKWFGGGGPQLGNFANTIGGEQGGMAMAAGVIGNSASNLAGAAGKKLGEIKGNADRGKQALEGNGASKDALDSFKNMSMLNQAKFGQKMGAAQKSVGAAGVGQLMNKYNDNIKEGQSPDDALKNAQEHYHEQNFGEDANELITGLTGENFSGAAYDRLVGTLQGKHDKLVRGGMSEEDASDAVKGIVSKTISDYNKLPDDKQNRNELGKLLKNNSTAVQAPSFKRPDVAGGENARTETKNESKAGTDIPPESDEKTPGSTPPESEGENEPPSKDSGNNEPKEPFGDDGDKK